MTTIPKPLLGEKDPTPPLCNEHRLIWETAVSAAIDCKLGRMTPIEYLEIANHCILEAQEVSAVGAVEQYTRTMKVWLNGFKN